MSREYAALCERFARMEHTFHGASGPGIHPAAVRWKESLVPWEIDQ